MSMMDYMGPQDMGAGPQGMGMGPGGGASMMEAPSPEETSEDSIRLLEQALRLVRQATDAEDDPQMSLAIEKISTLIQQAIAQDHGAGMKAMGMDPGQARVLARAR